MLCRSMAWHGMVMVFEGICNGYGYGHGNGIICVYNGNLQRKWYW